MARAEGVKHFLRFFSAAVKAWQQGAANLPSCVDSTSQYRQAGGEHHRPDALNSLRLPMLDGVTLLDERDIEMHVTIDGRPAGYVKSGARPSDQAQEGPLRSCVTVSFDVSRWRAASRQENEKTLSNSNFSYCEFLRLFDGVKLHAT